ncbi:transporter family protein [Mangrovibacterium marinum]|uniref:Transporter family protein n=1 Tax=Mangrovibacterium marinum TaxID=1639118 RepID=A0A2T5C4P1_9BACT|nr:EamA family transporter [Mangrovibacterium marinum]PTN09824.1 transporter family protein [Mangrovibacterium marinum]
MWVILALISAVLLGLYDVFKKLSLNDNGVLPVLFLSTVTAAVVVTPVVLGSAWFPQAFQQIHLYVPPITGREHLLIFIKSVIVVGSWIFAFHAMKHLPITLISPIRATGPIWTLIGAILIFQERLNAMQWVGVAITLFFFYLLSTAGKLEGISFRRNIWIFCIIAATLLGAASGLFDKYLLRQIDRIAVQAWFSFYQVVVMLPAIALFRWRLPREKRPAFEWRWSIPLIAIFLLFADYAYFYSLSIPDSMISIVSALRRGGVLVAFVTGAILFRERNIKKKGLYLLGILLGILIISFGTH